MRFLSAFPLPTSLTEARLLALLNPSAAPTTLSVSVLVTKIDVDDAKFISMNLEGLVALGCSPVNLNL